MDAIPMCGTTEVQWVLAELRSVRVRAPCPPVYGEQRAIGKIIVTVD
jgi:hypothetical protein